MSFDGCHALRLPLACLATLIFGATSGYAADWKPIAQEELTLTTPFIAKDADAEALFWDVHITDEVSGSSLATVYEEYVRIKIFTDRGREQNATVDIPYGTGVRVSEVAARTVKANGRIIELNKRDIRERTIVKVSGLKLKAISFAVPDLERGDIVEYRWKETHSDSLASFLRLRFWREIPTLEVNYYVKPLDIPGFTMRAQSFNGTFSAPERQRDGSTRVSLSHVPAYRDEPFSPPEHQIKPWVLIYYDDGTMPQTASQFWSRFAKELDSEYGKAIKVDDEVRSAAAQAVASADTEDARILALLDLVRARVKRVDVDTATDADLRNAKENKHSGETLKRGHGTADEMTVLFAALARAAGFDARIAAVPERNDVFFNEAYLNRYFVRGRIVAIKTGTGWRFVEPANRYSRGGALSWQHEWQVAMIPGQTPPALVETPLTPATASVKRRVATLRLLEDGTLDGDMSWTFSGHWNAIFKEQEDAETPADREKQLKDTLAERLPGAEITDVRVENVTEVGMAYKNSWKLRMPGFAQRTGTRLFVQPAIFQRGLARAFAESTRTADVYFQFPWVEDDMVTIDLPEGYTLEAPERPAPLDAGFAAYEATLGTNANGRQLVFRRRLAVGQKNQLLIKKDYYAIVKRFFDTVDESDARALALRRQAATAQ
jgi:hypothetical protein